MTNLLEKKISAFLATANATSEEALVELNTFFTSEAPDKVAVVNGNLSLYEAGELVKIVDVPRSGANALDAFRFDGTRISILNSSDSGENKKKSSGGTSSNNNNNNNNNNG